MDKPAVEPEKLRAKMRSIAEGARLAVSRRGPLPREGPLKRSISQTVRTRIR